MSADRKDFFRIRDFREILQRELISRQSRRDGYSVRAFARDLGMRQSTLHDVLAGRYGISNSVANQIASKLKFNEEQTKYFCDLVRSQHARSASERKLAAVRLEKYWTLLPMESLTDGLLSLFSKWYYLAILELITIKEGAVNATLLASSLGINENLAQESLKELQTMGAIKLMTNGRWVRIKKFIEATRPTPTKVIRDFHKQILQKSMDAIETQRISERKYLSTVFSISSSQIERARERLEEMHREFYSEFQTEKDPDAVYTISTQFFSMAKTNE